MADTIEKRLTNSKNRLDTIKLVGDRVALQIKNLFGL